MTEKKHRPGYEELKSQTLERLKELSTINRTTSILREQKSVEESLQRIAYILPQGWQYPEFTSARIVFNKEVYCSNNYKKTKWVLSQDFVTIDNKKGYIEIYYSKSFPKADEGPFLKEERNLIINLANIIAGFLSSIKGKAVLDDIGLPEKKEEEVAKDDDINAVNHQLLQHFLNKHNYERDLYHDLMPFKVKEILLIANLYDAYIIVKEGHFSEQILGEYAKFNLSSLPRITGATTIEEAHEKLNAKHFDLVIIMVGIDKKMPVRLSEQIKKEFPYIPVFLLLNNNSDIAIFEQQKKVFSYDKLFVWNGESKIFFSMVKHVEDYINVGNDTEKGLVRVMLIVEDSPIYYSRYLSFLYQIILKQTKKIIDDVSAGDLYRILKLRARPKILLATNYEEAIKIYNQYKDYIFCLVTDLKFPKNNKLYEYAGLDLVKHIRSEKKDLPVIIQSSNQDVEEEAYHLKSFFINKNAENLVQEFKSFIMHYLGFGNFVYRDKHGKKLREVKTLKEFVRHLQTVPLDSIIYHAKKDNFSLWLMARGEIQAAKILYTKKVENFKDAEEVREFLINIIQKFRNEQNLGKVITFDETELNDEENIVTLSDGAMGGKGRGLAFINSLIYNFNFSKHIEGINIKTPKTSFIGTEEFEFFFDSNDFHYLKTEDIPYQEIKKRFLKGKLTTQLIKRLKILVEVIRKPLAVRSSGLFEDSLTQPFAGIFETYLLPNNHPNPKVRIKQLMDAVKLVYASVYAPVARGYFKAVNHSIEEEKMAVVIQEVVGNQYEDMFYPHISGVAQSYNYYPFAHMKPEEGFAVAAFGLGKYVVEGEKAYRFAPKYPNTEILTPKDQLKNSQTEFYAVNLKNQEPDLLLGDTAALTKPDIYDAERHGTLKHCASTYDQNQTISAGIDKTGPRIINFANILKYNYIPLAKTIDIVLDIIKEALGSPVEIEFAVDLTKDKDDKASFYLLQIKPLIGNVADYDVDMNTIDADDIILYTKKGMGNGLIKNIQDVVYIDTAKFDKSETEEMVLEIERINEKMMKEDKPYILIGPGRWGTRDRWIGIPVNWPQISHAKVIVETSLEGHPLDASSGSHFFHNVTSANVGYFSVEQEKTGGYINYNILDRQELVEQVKYFRHIRFQNSVKVRMDGKKGISVITLK